MKNDDFGLGAIGQIAITVRDLDAAIAFYRDKLGMKLLFTAPPGMAFFDAGGIRLLLGASELSQEEPAPSILYYRVADIAAAAETLAARGVEMTHAPHLVHKAEDHDLWLAFLRDMDGNALALMSEVPRA